MVGSDLVDVDGISRDSRPEPPMRTGEWVTAQQNVAYGRAIGLSSLNIAQNLRKRDLTSVATAVIWDRY